LPFEVVIGGALTDEVSGEIVLGGKIVLVHLLVSFLFFNNF
jgi:hypothetical protein